MQDSRGFTLLELLVSITLMAVLVVVLSMALRSGINSYTRARQYNRAFFPATALQGLLYRQLEAVASPSNGSLSAFYLFQGERQKLTFVTSYAPQGIGRGGLFVVSYWYDSEEEALYYAQKVLVKREQIRDEGLEDLDRTSVKELEKDGWTVERLEGVKDLNLSYRHDSAEQEEDPSKWPEEFKRRRRLPLEVALHVELDDEGERESTGREWTVIPVGVL